MDLNEVLVFARVVQGGSFTAAAQVLGMPKSSVSKKAADFLATGDIREARLAHVLPDWCSVALPVHAVYPTARHVSPKVIRFVECLRDHFSRVQVSDALEGPA